MENAAEMSSGTAGLLVGLFAGALGLGIILLGVVWYILQVIAYWKIFTKAGKPGWHSIIPILNTWDQYDLSWNRTMAWVWLALFAVNSFLSRNATAAENAGEVYNPGLIGWLLGAALAVITVIGLYKLAKSFGRGIGFFFGLLLLNPIFMLILGFGDSHYQGRAG